MNLRNAESYDIGLDIGTASVGWAVLDDNGDICRFKGKPTWGSRLFPEAKTAAETRMHRGQRRRYDRRRQRIELLQGFFCPEIEKVDPDFFIRLNQSRLFPEDREENHRDYLWTLFNDTELNEPKYYEKFPTIFHLRAWLTETNEQADIRLIYLAMHNIVKHRGNFLYQDTPSLSAKNADVQEAGESLCNSLEAWCETNDLEFLSNEDLFNSILRDRSLRKADCQEKLKSALGYEKSSEQEYKKMVAEISKAIVGYKANFNQIFFSDSDTAKFTLDNDEKIEEYECPDDGLDLFESIRATYSAFILMGILQGAEGKTISFCKMAQYDSYHNDLEDFKSLIREYAPERYNEIFRGDFYPGTRKYNPKKAGIYTKYDLGEDKLSHQEFLNEVDSLLEEIGIQNDSRYLKIKEKIDDRSFLRRLKTSDNGSIPYQLNLEELNAIIEKQGKYYAFLVDEKEKIESLVTFRIPYYVGPLTRKNAAVDTKGKLRFAWSERFPNMENNKVYPWNWDEIIDRDASAELFINRMTGTCTYLQDEPVLPRHSLLYEEYCVLNELNGAKWAQGDGDKYRFDYYDRQGILEDLFKHKKSVKYKDVEEWLSKKHGPSTGCAYHVSGGQGEARFESSLSSYIDFCKILGKDELSDVDISMIEKIIHWSTVFEDQSIYKRKVISEYGKQLSEKQIDEICRHRYQGWGRLSKKLLDGIKAETDEGLKTIMDILRDGDPNNNKRLGRAMNFMEILHDPNFGFEKKIDAINSKVLEELTSVSVDDLPGSPALRRGINQALRIVDEIASIAGKPPAHIFIEVTRDEDFRKKGKRTKSRQQKISSALDSLKGDYDNLNSLKKEFRNCRQQDFDDKRLALYFMQCGKCMYSEEPLDINRLSTYQIDHIMPQSYVKDDSLENLVLVMPKENQYKLDTLFLDKSLVRKRRGFWRELYEAGLMGDKKNKGYKKFNNLTRMQEPSENEIKGFVQRQLVETSQIIKQVQQLLQAQYTMSRVLPVKAGISSQLREKCDFVKCREANDFHHAHDAYLACHLGRFILYRHSDIYERPEKVAAVVQKFVRSQNDLQKSGKRAPYSSGFVVSSFLTSGFDSNTGEIFRDTWNASEEIARIRRCLDYKDCFISRMPEESHGEFWDQNPISPKSNKKLNLQIKKGLETQKYGGYSREQFAYFFVYEVENLKTHKHSLEFAGVPVHIASSLRSEPNALEEYAYQNLIKPKQRFVRVRKSKIYKYQQIIVDGNRLFITGIREVRNARQFAFTQEETKLIKRIQDCEDYDENKVMQLFDGICKRFNRFAKRLGRQLNVLELREPFEKASLDDRRTVLINLLEIASAHRNMIDLHSVGGSKYAGQMHPTFSKELSTGNTDFYFIDVSVTGMFERRYKLGL